MNRKMISALFLVWALGAGTAQTLPTPVPTPVPGVTPVPGATPLPGASPLPGTTPVPSVTPVPVAKPYSDEEFPNWVLKVRRAETITVGAFPLAFLFVGLGYDYVYYFTNGLPKDNMPWPAGPGTSQWSTSTQGDLVQKKNITLVAASLGVGLILAVVDWWLGENQP